MVRALASQQAVLPGLAGVLEFPGDPGIVRRLATRHDAGHFLVSFRMARGCPVHLPIGVDVEVVGEWVVPEDDECLAHGLVFLQGFARGGSGGVLAAA